MAYTLLMKLHLVLFCVDILLLLGTFVVVKKYSQKIFLIIMVK